MQRSAVLLVLISSIGFLVTVASAASPGRGACRRTPLRRGPAPLAPVGVPSPVSVVPSPVGKPFAQPPANKSPAFQGTSSPAPGPDLEAEIAKLERQVADLMRQQAQREAEEAMRPRSSGWISVGTGAGGARIGVGGFWED
jgi:hypothetical protein